jgi:toxin ParE1/3/4
VRLRYTQRGAAELAEALDYIGERSPRGAKKVQRRVQSVIEALLKNPNLGRATSRGDLRRIAAHPYPYLVFYTVERDEIVIHGVRHGARRPSSMPDGQ